MYTVLNTTGQTTLTSTLPVSWSWSEQNYFIGGTLVINSVFPISQCKFKMGNNASIRVDNGASVGISFSKFFACGSDRWLGFSILPNSTGNLGLLRCEVEDATDAFTVQSAASFLWVVGNTINRNQRGFFSNAGQPLNIIWAGNTVDCTSNLNGTTTSSETGMDLQNCPMVKIGLNETAQASAPHPLWKNTFKRQQRGINMFNSTARVGLSDFNLNTHRGILLDQNSSLTLIGGVNAKKWPPVTFSDNEQDIAATSSALNVKYAHFEKCNRSNIASVSNGSNQIISISDSHFNLSGTVAQPANSKHAIEMARTNGGAGGTRNQVYQDTVVVEAFGTFPRGGIKVTGHKTFASAGTMKIHFNEIYAHAGGRSPASTSFLEFVMGAANNNIIDHNYINTINTSPAFGVSTNRWAIYLHDGSAAAVGNEVTANDVYGNGNASDDNGTCAMHNENCYSILYCSNETGHTYRGVHFMGNCGKARFWHNRLGDHEMTSFGPGEFSTGLLLENFDGTAAFLGTQFCAANEWRVNNYATTSKAAWFKNFGTPAALTANRFTAKNNDPLDFYFPDPLDPDGTQSPFVSWFVKDPCTSEPNPCDNTAANPTIGREINDNDIRLAQTYPTWQANDGLDVWEEKKQLLLKLFSAPNLIGQNVYVSNFFNAHINASPYRFAQFDSMLTVAAGTPAALQDSLLLLESLFSAVSNRLDSLDGTLREEADLLNISNTFIAYRRTLLSEAGNLTLRMGNVRAQTELYRQPFLAACEAYNHALPLNTVYEINQKFLNRLGIQSVRGMVQSAADNDTLRLIANQCPEVAGRTRSRAINWLPSDEAPNYRSEFGDVNAGCTGHRSNEDERIALVTSSGGMSIVPNPAHDAARVLFDQPYLGDLVLADVSGKAVALYRSINGQYLDLNLSGLNAGVYLLSAQSSSGLRPCKLVIFR